MAVEIITIFQSAVDPASWLDFFVDILVRLHITFNVHDDHDHHHHHPHPHPHHHHHHHIQKSLCVSHLSGQSHAKSQMLQNNSLCSKWMFLHESSCLKALWAILVADDKLTTVTPDHSYYRCFKHPKPYQSIQKGTPSDPAGFHTSFSFTRPCATI